MLNLLRCLHLTRFPPPPEPVASHTTVSLYYKLRLHLTRHPNCLYCVSLSGYLFSLHPASGGCSVRFVYIPHDVPPCYRIWKFITAFRRARHISLSWAILLEFTLSHRISWRFILILSSRLLVGLTRGPFPSGFPTTILWAFLMSRVAL